MPKGEKAKPVAWLNLNDAARGKVENPVNWAYSLLVIRVHSCSRKERLLFFFFMWRIKLWEISKDSSEVRHCSRTCEVICSLSGLLKRDSCSSVRMAFSHVSSPEAITRGGRRKAPAERWKALWHRRTYGETRGAQVQIFFFIHPSFCSLLTSSAFSLQETL